MLRSSGYTAVCDLKHVFAAIGVFCGENSEWDCGNATGGSYRSTCRHYLEGNHEVQIDLSSDRTTASGGYSPPIHRMLNGEVYEAKAEESDVQAWSAKLKSEQYNRWRLK